MRSYRPEELFDAGGTLLPALAAAGAGRRAAHGRESARQRRPAAARSPHAGFPRLRGRRAGARRRSTPKIRACSAASCATSSAATTRHATSGSSAPTRRCRTGSTRCSKRPSASGWPRRQAGRSVARAGRARARGAQRAPVPGLARRLPADRASRPVQHLRGVHPHRRLDVQPAREVAEGHARPAVAAADRVAELPARQPRLAAGPQRLHPPGSRLHRPRRQQEGGDRPRLPAAGRQLPPERHGPLPPQPALRQHRRRRASTRRRSG